MVVDLGEAQVGEGESPEAVHGLVGRDRPGRHVGEQALQSGFVHDVHYPAWVWPRTHLQTPSNGAALRIGFLGPEGTFTEEALLGEADYRSAQITPLGSLVDVLDSVREGQVDLGFVPLENAIEGTVRDIIDSLVFDFDLRIQREVVLDIHLHLMAPPGTALDDVERVASIPMATAQCRGFLTGTLPAAEVLATNSTADAARLVGGHDPAMSARPTAAIAPRLAATLYGLDILVEDVEDHPDNQTRFVVPGPVGHPRTHRPRPDQHRLLPERRPPWQPARHSGPVRGPRHQPEQAGVEADQAGTGRLLLHHRLRGPRRRCGRQ